MTISTTEACESSIISFLRCVSFSVNVLLVSLVRVAYMSVSFRTSLEMCIKRNAERVASVPENIIHRMNSRFEWPNAAISPWERYNLELDGSISDIVEEIEKFVEFVLKQPLVFIDWEKLEAERNKSREINRMNPVHVIDDVLRSLVNACVNSLSRSSDVPCNS